MAIASDTIWEVQTSGLNTNGGGFAASYQGVSGVDYSQWHRPYKAPTTLAGFGTTTLVCGSPDTFDPTVLGNIIFINGQGRYVIQAYINSTGLTLDRILGTFSSTSGSIGGAVALPSDISAVTVVNNFVWIKSGVYQLTGVAINVGHNRGFSGYGVQRNDEGMAWLEASGMNAGVQTLNMSDHSTCRNLIISNSKAYSFHGGSLQSTTINCIAISGANGGFSFLQNAFNCFSSGNLFGFSCTAAVCCAAVFNQQYGFNAKYCISCLAYHNSVVTSNTYDGFQAPNEGCVFAFCTSHGNGRQRYGFNVANKTTVYNCIATNHTSRGFSFGFGTSAMYEFGGAANNAAYSNTSANFFQLPPMATGNYNLTADPFENAAALNFVLNNTAGGGAAIKQSGFPGRIIGTNSIGYHDIGAIQSQPPTSSPGGGGNSLTFITDFNGGFNG